MPASPKEIQGTSAGNQREAPTTGAMVLLGDCQGTEWPGKQEPFGFPEQCPQGNLQRWPPVKTRGSLPVGGAHLRSFSFQQVRNHLLTGPQSCLLSGTTATMPRGQKSKLRAREKRRQNRAEAQGLKSAQAATAEEEATASSTPVTVDGASSSSVAGSLQAPASVSAPTSAAAGVSGKRSDVRAKSHVQKSKKSQAAPSSESSGQDLLTRKAGILANYLLFKYKMNEPIKRADMLKVIHKRYREQFPEILKKASEHLDLFFDLEVKEVKPNGHSYSIVCKLDDTSDGSVSRAWQFPTKGILMPLLGLIYLKGNHASEEEVWELLNVLGVYAGKTHFIFGEPQKLITQDLVQEDYLEYRQVPGSDPPRFEFLWGPRAQAETTKMKVLDFLSKVNNTVPTALPSHCEETLRGEQERAQAAATATAGTTAKARARAPGPRRAAAIPTSEL